VTLVSKCAEVTHKKVSCGREPVVRHAKVENLTNCRRKHPEERNKKAEEDKLKRESNKKYSKGGGRTLKVTKNP
jgi:hypothetical protein